MKSIFDLQYQNSQVDGKIVVALERISEAFRVLLWEESKDHSLSPIQIQILIFILFQDPNRCKISYLSREFNMTKATISDSVKTLLNKNLLEKIADDEDSRSFKLFLTESGKTIAEKASMFAGSLAAPLQSLNQEKKEIMLHGLLRLIRDLHHAGIITLQRMCFTCQHYRNERGQHFCNLLQTRLKDADLRIDCPEHIEMK